MNSRSDFVKTAIIVTVMALLLAVPAAYSADWSKTVEGVTFECNVKPGVIGGFGVWNSLNATYEFCSGRSNRAEYGCGKKNIYSITDNEYRCEQLPTPHFECDGKLIDMTNVKPTFILAPGTQGAQAKVCEDLFQSMGVTVRAR